MANQNTAIMVAPNGARWTNKDHPGIPVTIEQTIECAVRCQQAGAHALHAHVRDKQKQHLLDEAAYRQLLTLAEKRLGSDFPVQITTEAFGLYSAEEQIQLVETLKPRYASIAMRELIRDEQHISRAQDFYQRCVNEAIGVQHILYNECELQQFETFQSEGIIPVEHKAILMVVGRYTDSVVADINESLNVSQRLAKSHYHWMLCAFGKTETECLLQAAHAGGGVRVGFENNQEHSDGRIAKSNEERVTALHTALRNDDTGINTNRLNKLLGGL